jgi:hypothetical protein
MSTSLLTTIHNQKYVFQPEITYVRVPRHCCLSNNTDRIQAVNYDQYVILEVSKRIQFHFICSSLLFTIVSSAYPCITDFRRFNMQILASQ